MESTVLGIKNFSGVILKPICVPIFNVVYAWPTISGTTEFYDGLSINNSAKIAIIKDNFAKANLFLRIAKIISLEFPVTVL